MQDEAMREIRRAGEEILLSMQRIPMRRHEAPGQAVPDTVPDEPGGKPSGYQGVRRQEVSPA